MANRWETMETVADFIFLGSKITADGDCRHEIKRHLLFGRKVMTNLDSILKSRDINFANQSPSSQSYGFSSNHIWMWELDYKESWALKNWFFQTVVWRRLLRVPWKDWCWSWNSSTLATWCKDLTHWRRLWCWERLKVGGEGDDRGWDDWIASPTQWT